MYEKPNLFKTFFKSDMHILYMLNKCKKTCDMKIKTLPNKSP